MRGECFKELDEGGYLTRDEPVVRIRECGTDKTRLATGLCVAVSRVTFSGFPCTIVLHHPQLALI